MPKPRDERVRLERAPTRTVVVLRFRGRVTAKCVHGETEVMVRLKPSSHLSWH